VVENWFRRSGSHNAYSQNLIDGTDVADRMTFQARFDAGCAPVDGGKVIDGADDFNTNPAASSNATDVPGRTKTNGAAIAVPLIIVLAIVVGLLYYYCKVKPRNPDDGMRGNRTVLNTLKQPQEGGVASGREVDDAVEAQPVEGKIDRNGHQHETPRADMQELGATFWGSDAYNNSEIPNQPPQQPTIATTINSVYGTGDDDEGDADGDKPINGGVEETVWTTQPSSNVQNTPYGKGGGGPLHGARFRTEIYTRGCHWILRMFD
jgi:hypothetical protein